MDKEFWRARWQEGRIGFHEGKANTFLARHIEWLASCQRILVPLCGKAEDLAYLASQGHEVIGIELVESAVQQFFAEHATTPALTTGDSFTTYRAGSITILVGDFFATTRELVGTIDGIYDRAALIALPPSMRGQYVAHLNAIAPDASREFLVSLEYPDGAMEGPPFSVAKSEVENWFPTATLVEEAPAPRFPERGLVERCYTIELR